MAREKRIESLGALWALIREDLAVNHGQFTRPGFQAIAVHRFGVWKHGIESKLLRVPMTVIYRLANLFVRNVYGIELHLETRIGRRVHFTHQHGITVDRNAVIGDDCTIHQMVTIGRYEDAAGPLSPAPRLGNRVNIGVGAVIAGEIEIGDNVNIGPNTVVMQSVPAGAIVTAPPSRVMARPPRRKLEAEPELREKAS